MNRQHFLDAIQINGKVVTKRCTESYLQSAGLYQWLIDNTPEDFTSVSEKIKHVMYGGGYCSTCGRRTNVAASGKGFAVYCSLHFHEAKRGRKAHNKKQIDVDKVIDLYVNQHKSIVEIAKIIGNVSNVTLKKALSAADVKLRPHSENQKLHSSKKGSITHLYDADWWKEQYATKSSDQLARELGCSPSLVLQRLKQYSIPAVNFNKDTEPEKIIISILDSIGIPYEKKVRSVLTNNRELDFIIPSKNIAVEVNGIFWHSSAAGKTSDYHLQKTLDCTSKNIQLLHFWDQELIQKPSIVESIIQAKLGICKKVYARKCVVKEVDSAEAKEFFNTTHMQGYIPAAKYVGLYHAGELACLGSFSRPRFNTKYHWELIRFSSKIGTTVVGGLSRILSQVHGTILSYANRRWSDGNAYHKCGFNFVGETKPSYFYTKDFRVLENRMKFQKHKLVSLPSYDISKSESKIMEEAGYSKVWDCGQLIFVRP